MQLWDFEPWLTDLLAALDGITSAEGFTASTGLLYGVTITSTSGARVLIHLTRGSGPSDERDLPPEHLARVAELEGVPARDLEPLEGTTAAKVEHLLRNALDLNPPPGCVLSMTFHDRRTQEARTAKVRGKDQEEERAQAGLVVQFDDASEIYLRIFRA